MVWQREFTQWITQSLNSVIIVTKVQISVLRFGGKTLFGIKAERPLALRSRILKFFAGFTGDKEASPDVTGQGCLPQVGLPSQSPSLSLPNQIHSLLFTGISNRQYIIGGVWNALLTAFPHFN
jgi:hypothetical protein